LKTHSSSQPCEESSAPVKLPGMWRLSVWALLLCAVGAGCSFNRDWKRAAGAPIGTNEIRGAWIGHWRSDANSHYGQLRCILTPHSTDSYMARFRARFWKIFAASYAVPLTVTTTNDGYTFKGSANLGALGGGLYTYEGSITPGSFQSTYRSKHDHGTFLLRRPVPGE
jgi:hypothetical protein